MTSPRHGRGGDGDRRARCCPGSARTAVATRRGGRWRHGWPGVGQLRRGYRAGRELVPEQDVGHPPRAPARRRDDRGEQADTTGVRPPPRGGPDPCCPRHGLGAAQDRGQLGEVGLAGEINGADRGAGGAAEVGGAGGGDARRHATVTRASRHHHRPAVVDQGGHDRPGVGRVIERAGTDTAGWTTTYGAPGRPDGGSGSGARSRNRPSSPVGRVCPAASVRARAAVTS